MTSLSWSSSSYHSSASLRMCLMFEIAGSAKLVSQIFWWCDKAAVVGCFIVRILNRFLKEKLSEALKGRKHRRPFRWITCWAKFLPWNFLWIDHFLLELPNHERYPNSVCCRMGFQTWEILFKQEKCVDHSLCGRVHVNLLQTIDFCISVLQFLFFLLSSHWSRAIESLWRFTFLS
jgi:hypothetical protein